MKNEVVKEIYNESLNQRVEDGKMKDRISAKRTSINN